MENEYSSLITNLEGQIYQRPNPLRETGEDRDVNIKTSIPKNYSPSTYILSGNILVFSLSPELLTLYPSSIAKIGDKAVSVKTLESPLEVKVGETVCGNKLGK